jgi:hypothetical protein
MLHSEKNGEKGPVCRVLKLDPGGNSTRSWRGIARENYEHI